MVDSPCTGYCRTENGVCQGCGRTIDEIMVWQSLSDEEKEEIIERVEG
jgi:predicted Fe-S protein YdhL (DUF1289 family)